MMSFEIEKYFRKGKILHALQNVAGRSQSTHISLLTAVALAWLQKTQKTQALEDLGLRRPRLGLIKIFSRCRLLQASSSSSGIIKC